MRVAVLALDNVFDLGLSAVLDAFQTANELIEVSGLAVPRFDVRIVGVRRTVRTSQGFSVPVHAPTRWSPDCVVVPHRIQDPGPLEIALARPDVRDAASALRQWSRRRRDDDRRLHRYVRDGRVRPSRPARATTTWWLAPLFRKRYPGVMLDEAHMI